MTDKPDKKHPLCRDCQTITNGLSQCEPCHDKMVKVWVKEQEKKHDLREFKQTTKK
jgi:hypothetical protein